uniref:Uncharacterized protein n=1 Tax=Arundo donax TaxID=35708 RepID=A0A0A8ZVD2_ARUDO
MMHVSSSLSKSVDYVYRHLYQHIDHYDPLSNMFTKQLAHNI